MPPPRAGRAATGCLQDRAKSERQPRARDAHRL